MRGKAFKAILLASVLVASCSNSQFGIAHQILQDTYPGSAYGRTVYSESLLRSAAGFAGLDSNHELSARILYVLHFEMDMNSRRYIEGTDSIVLAGLNTAGMEAFARMEGPEKAISLFVKEEGDAVVDAVVIARDSSNYSLYEVVGEIPLRQLYQLGSTNLEGFSQLVNFDLFSNGEPDTSDQGSQ